MNKKTYLINVTRSEYGWTEVNAKDEAEAEDLVLSGDIDVNWMNEDLEVTTIKEKWGKD